MSTEIRPSLSEKNPYWIEKHRYYELKHFCLQYPLWKKAYAVLEARVTRPTDLAPNPAANTYSDPAAECAIAKAFYSDRIELIQKLSEQADSELADYILKGVTRGWTYERLKSGLSIPCCREMYYDRYRRFFWLLSRERD